jgi:hypothetical protein
VKTGAPREHTSGAGSGKARRVLRIRALVDGGISASVICDRQDCFRARAGLTLRRFTALNPESFMTRKPILFAASILPLLAGCISHEETSYRDVARVPVEFENETAGRTFYEGLSRMRTPQSVESKTDVSIPVVFEHKTREVSGPNLAFNNAVTRCDTNKDGRITELEAKIFAQNLPK